MDPAEELTAPAAFVEDGAVMDVHVVLQVVDLFFGYEIQYMVDVEGDAHVELNWISGKGLTLSAKWQG